ncbi:MAG TPA: hypothetical protein VGG05_18195 [Pseudonocardiaceae bacterium]
MICDGAAFHVQGRNEASHIFQQVIDAGVQEAELVAFLDRIRANTAMSEMSQPLFDQQRQRGLKHGILTLAPGWTTANKQTNSPGSSRPRRVTTSTW